MNLRKEGGKRANRIPRADCSTQPRGCRRNLRVRRTCSLTANLIRRKTMQLANRSLRILRNCSTTTRGSMTKSSASHRPSPRTLRTRTVRDTTPISHRRRTAELRHESFQSFMAMQTFTRHDYRREHTRHMLSLRVASWLNGAAANDVLLPNSHDGTSRY